MKKETLKRLAALLCVAVLVFSNVGSVLAETNTNPPVADQEGIELPEDVFDSEQETPETPEVPETPETPETPEVPETPETPETPEHTHSYVGTITKEPTTTEKGEKKFTCECGDTYTVEIPVIIIGVPSAFKVANNGYTQIRLTWEKVSDVDGYRIYRSDSEEGEFELVESVEPDIEKYVDKNLTTDQKYYYKMAAFKGEFEGEFTEVKSGTPKVIVPKMKKTATVTGTSIKVSWNKSTGAHGYYVYRKQGSSGTWKQIATIKDPDTTSYKDTTATGRYYYAVRAYKKVDGNTYTSLRANSIQASVLKKASIAVAQKGSQRAVTVKWSKIANATGYQVYKKVGKNGSWVLAKTTGKDARSYSCEIPQGKYTYWKVRAIRDIGEVRMTALFSEQKTYIFANPKFVYETSTNYGKSVKNIKLTIENTASQDVRFYSKNTAIISEYNDSYNRELYIVGSSGNKLNYSTVNPGKTKTITYKVDGSSTRYQSDSILCFTFRYDGLEYVLLAYADGSYHELYLAEDLWE